MAVGTEGNDQQCAPEQDADTILKRRVLPSLSKVL